MHHLIEMSRGFSFNCDHIITIIIIIIVGFTLQLMILENGKNGVIVQCLQNYIFESIRCEKVELIGNENGDIQLYTERVHDQHENAIGIEETREKGGKRRNVFVCWAIEHVKEHVHTNDKTFHSSF
jgi:hypothetical protein